jgi:hypothetical protein
MRDALNLMAKVFAVVFGAGSAVVVLLYLVLGAFYIYGRIEQARQNSQPKFNPNAPYTSEPPKIDLPAGFIPDAQVDCPTDRKSKDYQWCSVLIDGKAVANLSRQEMRDSLAGWVDVPSGNSR